MSVLPSGGSNPPHLLYRLMWLPVRPTSLMILCWSASAVMFGATFGPV